MTLLVTVSQASIIGGLFCPNSLLNNLDFPKHWNSNRQDLNFGVSLGIQRFNIGTAYSTEASRCPVKFGHRIGSLCKAYTLMGTKFLMAFDSVGRLESEMTGGSERSNFGNL